MRVLCVGRCMLGRVDHFVFTSHIHNSLKSATTGTDFLFNRSMSDGSFDLRWVMPLNLVYVKSVPCFELFLVTRMLPPLSSVQF